MLTLLILTAVGIVAAVGLSAIALDDPCDISTLTTASKCFNCLSKSEKQALKVWFYAQALKASGGTDYTDPNALSEAVACFKCEPSFVLDSFNVAVAQDLAVEAGFTEGGSMTIAQLRAAIKCLVCTDAKTLEAAETVLLCRLVNFFAGPPIL